MAEVACVGLSPPVILTQLENEYPFKSLMVTLHGATMLDNFHEFNLIV
jgi:hypothetical protein